MLIPTNLLPHTVQVRALLGRSSTGKVYGPVFSLQCMAQGGVRIVRGPDGVERTSTLTLYAALDAADKVPPGSEVTWRGDHTEVLVSMAHDDGGMGAPQHAEVVCE